jgi:hypothetical protein
MRGELLWLGCDILCAERKGVIDQPRRIREGGTEGRAHSMVCTRYLVGKIFGALLCTSRENQVPTLVPTLVPAIAPFQSSVVSNWNPAQAEVERDAN